MTLSETLLSLSIAGILATFAAPQARRGLDGLQVRAAREAVFGAAVRTRALALARGGASLLVDAEQRTATVTSAAGIPLTHLSLAEFDVDIAADGAAPVITLAYDGRGLGRMASRTVHFRKGAAHAALTFSSYGRVRRW